MAERLFNNSRFSFIGELTHSKEPMTTKKLSDTSKWNRTRLGVGVKNDQNMQFLNMEYIHSDTVNTCKLFSKDGESFDVKLSETTLESNINKVSDFSKIVIDLETDFDKKKEYTAIIFKIRNLENKKYEDDATKEEKAEDQSKLVEYKAQLKELANNRVEFCHVKDAIKFLNASLPVLKDKKVRVTGTVKSNFYNGKNNLQYIPSFIELVPSETENQLKAFIDLFYEKDSIDDDKSLKKMIVNGWIGEKIKKADKLYPLSVVLDYTKIDETNDAHKMLLEFMKDIFKITDKKQVHKIGLEINVINGAEVVEFTEDCLTDQQKVAIKLGFNKLEDFKPRGNTYGNKVQELKVSKSDLKNYPTGSVESFAVKDISDYLVQDDSNVRATDIKQEEKVEETKTPTTSTDDLMKSLFG